MTDVWTSAGVLVGVSAVAVTGWLRLDPIVALLVAANILWTGFSIVRSSIGGLMDAALPAGENECLFAVLREHEVRGIQFHAVRSRIAGSRRFISMHVIVPGEWTVNRGHELLEMIEHEVRYAIPNSHVFTHLESADDPLSWDDIGLDRGSSTKDGA